MKTTMEELNLIESIPKTLSKEQISVLSKVLKENGDANFIKGGIAGVCGVVGVILLSDGLLSLWKMNKKH